MLKLILLASLAAAVKATTCGFPAIEPNTVSSTIVGGTPAKPNSWPWQVEVIKTDFHYCGGTLINNQWVVSAAHCFSALESTRRYTFSMGGHLENVLVESTRQSRTASKIIRHQDYSAITSSNDIALIKLDTPVVFDDYVSPACLTESAPAPDTMAWITGWGNQETVVQDPNLHQVDVPIVSRATCQAAYPQYNIDASMICAGYLSGGKDSCQGDSGGPLVVQDRSGRWDLAGVVSWGVGCADVGYVGVYGNIAYLRPWIEYTMAYN